VAKCCSPLKDDKDELAGVEDTAVARISDGGGSVALRRWFGGAPAANRGVAPESTKGVNLRQGRLSGAGANPKEKKGR
jgi:hypothetical protein